MKQESEEGLGLEEKGQETLLPSELFTCVKLIAGHLTRAFAQLIDALHLCEYCTLEETTEPNIVMFRARPNSSLANCCRKSILC